MKLSVVFAIAATLVVTLSSANADILLQDFTSGPSGWEVKTDEVIPGGSSSGALFVASDRSYFDGTVQYQPFIYGPGFVKIVGTKSFPDISSCAAIEVTINSPVGYNGYYIAFGDTVPAAASAIPFEWRTDIPLQASGTNGTTIPFAAFSSSWNFGTGRIDVPCLANPAFCPPSSVLRNIKFMEIWAQGVAGQFDTDLFTIKGVGGC
eukprot:CAMPEP_0198114218 /NCGR_PEP_ID=MMETSP1442-20131203/5663_1 /TAXON_ID= /ORGANISM="Craspedostauros australis, Strain CCMP3328" /LENGTH=206 /DNA_ID=CAMNT_0043771485 /DNA_START=524 /DNA_END=1144 /DNA_ORIENTATION=-